MRRKDLDFLRSVVLSVVASAALMLVTDALRQVSTGQVGASLQRHWQPVVRLFTGGQGAR